MAKKIGVLGGGLNPMGLHQLACIEALAPIFDLIVSFPSGPKREDGNKGNIDYIPTRHRATIIWLTAQGLSDEAFSKTEQDFSDLERPSFTPAYKLDAFIREKYARYFPGEEIEIWNVVGSDWFMRNEENQVKVKTWKQGEEVWQNLNFAIMSREGYEPQPCDLPPHRLMLPFSIPGSSSDIRKIIPEAKHIAQAIRHLVSPRVAEYIERFKLYTATAIPAIPVFQTDHPVIQLEYDTEKSQACRLAQILNERLRSILADNGEEPNILLRIGGDGFMNQSVNLGWERRTPFIGYNVGRRGFLMNSIEKMESITPEFFTQRFDLYEAPLLAFSVTDRSGEASEEHYALNDVYMKSVADQQGWFRLSINGQVVVDCLPADALLVTTPTGSTAYWRNIGGQVFNVGSGELGIGAVAPDRDYNFDPMLVMDDSVITIENAGDPAKRPTIICGGGLVSTAKAVKVDIRMSGIAHCQILSLPGQRKKKVMRLQGPVGFNPI